MVVPLQPAPLRKSPPTGVFTQPGDQFSNTVPGTSYVITDQVYKQNLFHTDKWIQIAPVDAKGKPDLSRKGWSYWGNSETLTSPNFEAKMQ